MTDRELMQEAWEALNLVLAPFPVDDIRCMRVAKKLQERLAQPEQEPVAWMYTGIKQDGTEHGPHLVWKPAYMDAMSADKGAKATPLYTHPPQRKPLTDEEIDKIYETKVWDARRSFARAIEAAHGIGEQA